MTQVSQPKSHMKLILIILSMVAIFCVTVFYFGFFHKKQDIRSVKIEGTLLPTAKEMGDFQFTSHHNEPFSKENLKGHWTMLFFGFTNCGYVCPTTLTELNKMYQILQKDLPEKSLPQVVLVSVDPERDTVQRMNDYIVAFNPKFIGIRADIAETERLENQLHIAAMKVPMEGNPDQYMINHSAEILLLNPEGNIQAYLSFPHKADRLASDYQLILNTLS